MFHGAVDLSIDRFFICVQNSHNVRARHTYIGEINYVDSTVHFKRNRNFKWLSGYS
jgi:hypothetical protein